MLNLEKYADLQKKRDKNKKKCYKTILKNINTIIEKNMDNLMDHIIYEAPLFIIGELDYDMLESIDYITKKMLNDKNFSQILVDVKFIEPNILYVQWNLDKLKK